MAIVRTYSCEVCSNEFDVFHANRDEPAPDVCPFCGGVADAPRVPIPSGGHIGGSAIARSVDTMYRDTEKASEHRAELAGDPTLKVTNMRDNLREGDVAAMPVNNPVTQYAEKAGHQFFTQDMSGMLSMTKQGQVRDTGAVGLKAIQSRPGASPSGPAGITGTWGGGVKG